MTFVIYIIAESIGVLISYCVALSCVFVSDPFVIELGFSYDTGPNLNGLFGRQSGTTPGYSYSAANKSMAVNWEEKTLYDYLLNPKKVVFLSP